MQIKLHFDQNKFVLLAEVNQLTQTVSENFPLVAPELDQKSNELQLPDVLSILTAAMKIFYNITNLILTVNKIILVVGKSDPYHA